MTWYMMAVAAIEAAGAALLPTGPDGLVGGLLLAGVVVAYGVCLLPTWVVAGGPGWPGRRGSQRPPAAALRAPPMRAAPASAGLTPWPSWPAAPWRGVAAHTGGSGRS